MLNFRIAFRSLLKTPLVTAVAMLSLALGIGANAALFSIFERMVLRSLPVANPQLLVNFTDTGPRMGSISAGNAGGGESVFSYPMLRDLEKLPDTVLDDTFVGIAGHCQFGANLAYRGSTLSTEGLLVSGSYFPMLGLRPAAGRLFTPADDVNPKSHPLAVLSYGYWKERFNQDPGVVGESLVVNGLPMTIIGVTPQGFRGTTLGNRPQVFVPLSMRGTVIPGWDAYDNRRSYWVYLFGRLEDGVSVEQASAAINGTYGALIQEVELPLQDGMSEKNLARFRQKELTLAPGHQGQSSLRGGVQTPLLFLLIVTGIVLLIASANIANLLLIKATHRSSEIAVQLSLGATRRHLVLQLLTESMLLALGGGLLGFFVARGTLSLIASLLPSGNTFDFAFTLGPTTALVLLLLSLLTGLVGLFPALHSTRHSLTQNIRGQSSLASNSRGASRFRTGLATAQIALSMTLLIAAGLFTKSLANVSRVDLGIEVEPLSTFGLSPELNNYTPEQTRVLFQRVEEEIRALPGVRRVTAALVPLLAGDNWGSNVSVEGFESGPDVDSNARFNAVGPGFFRTVGIPLLSGREFESADTLQAPQVAIVNQTFANKFNLGMNAVGKRMQVGSGGELDIEIVGLVADAKYSAVKDKVPPLFYLPYLQDDSLGALTFYVQSDGDPQALLGTLRGVVSRLDESLPVENLRTMKLQVQENVYLDRLLSTLSAAFSILATLLAAVGLYGVLAYGVAQRTRELGLRMALGANQDRIVGLILRQVGWMAIPGAIIGGAAALALGKVAASQLFELQGHDPTVFLVATVILVIVAFLAGWIPARRAAKVSPMEALREG